MAKKKYYAVKNGTEPGIYETWDECQKRVKGYKGALYKSFTSLDEAKAYLNETDDDFDIQDTKQEVDFDVEDNKIICYVDGSYNAKTKIIGYGAILFYDGKKESLSGFVNDESLVEMRNVVGEIEAVKAAIEFACIHDYKKMDIYYDYLGIEYWATGVWKANKEYTKQYVSFIQKQTIDIRFHKVLAHSGVVYNEEVDKLAKKACGNLNEEDDIENEEVCFEKIEENTALSSEQEKALEILKSGKDVFLTGKAGTGKSYLLRNYISLLKESGKNVVILAPTGIAAINIHGVTIHRAFEVKTGPIIPKRIKRVPEIILEAQIIIVDEISMCRIDLFSYMMTVIGQAEKLNDNHKQVIVVGDFYQLPPVTTENDLKVLKEVYPDYQKGYAFESESWKERGFQMIELTQNQRQNDVDFIHHLNRIREGDKSAIPYFNQRLDSKDNNGIVLCGTNKKANDINQEKLSKLKTKSRIYESRCIGEVSASDKPTSDQLELKVGCRVMILVNGGDIISYQNGSLGTIIKMHDDYVVVKLDSSGFEVEIDYYEWPIETYTLEGKEIKKQKIGSFIQLPIKLAYAITIHKSQGQTYDKVQLIPYCFDVGQLYVALSRVKTLSGLRLIEKIYDRYLLTNQKVKDFYKGENNE